jgi:site-specific recombinase XerC
MHDIDELIATYLNACEAEGKTPNTVWSYRTSLEDFRRVGHAIQLPTVATEYTVAHVYRFLQNLRARGVSAAFQHRRHREVKAFFSWCCRMAFLDQNVFARVPLVKLEQQIIQPFSTAEIEAMLAAQDRSQHHDTRNYALILFLLDTGVRASECIAIRLDDVDWERGQVRVLHGKGQKQTSCWHGSAHRGRTQGLHRTLSWAGRGCTVSRQPLTQTNTVCPCAPPRFSESQLVPAWPVCIPIDSATRSRRGRLGRARGKLMSRRCSATAPPR